jgi:hypothetical protein
MDLQIKTHRNNAKLVNANFAETARLVPEYWVNSQGTLLEYPAEITINLPTIYDQKITSITDASTTRGPLSGSYIVTPIIKIQVEGHDYDLYMYKNLNLKGLMSEFVGKTLAKLSEYQKSEEYSSYYGDYEQGIFFSNNGYVLQRPVEVNLED